MDLFGRKAHIILYQMYDRNYIALFVHPGSWYHTQSKRQKVQQNYYSPDFVQYYTGAWPGTWPVRGGCLGDGLAGAGSLTVAYSMPAPQKKCRPYRTITEWDTMLTDETQSRYNLNPATSRTFWFQNRDPLYLTAVKQNIVLRVVVLHGNSLVFAIKNFEPKFTQEIHPKELN